MQAHRMVLNENSPFANEYNLPKELWGLPLEVIVLPLYDKAKENNLFQEIQSLADFNKSQNIKIDKSINISVLADEVNG